MRFVVLQRFAQCPAAFSKDFATHTAQLSWSRGISAFRERWPVNDHSLLEARKIQVSSESPFPQRTADGLELVWHTHSNFLVKSMAQKTAYPWKAMMAGHPQVVEPVSGMSRAATDGG